jgi:hypothetical protein
MPAATAARRGGQLPQGRRAARSPGVVPERQRHRLHGLLSQRQGAARPYRLDCVGNPGPTHANELRRDKDQASRHWLGGLPIRHDKQKSRPGQTGLSSFVQSSDAISADAGYCSPREACVAGRFLAKRSSVANAVSHDRLRVPVLRAGQPDPLDRLHLARPRRIRSNVGASPRRTLTERQAVPRECQGAPCGRSVRPCCTAGTGEKRLSDASFCAVPSVSAWTSYRDETLLV